MKRVLSVQDLSCVGRCSLTVALPVLSAMGLECSVLPTAVLSTHTAFSTPRVVSMTEHLADFFRHWQENHIRFDGVSVGYLSDPAQAAVVGQIVSEIGSPLILDPVMGDHGHLYRRITPEHVTALRSLAAQAQVLLPNLTEAAAMAGLPYRAEAEEGYLRELTDRLLALGTGAVVITGVHGNDGAIGFYGRTQQGESFSYQAEYVPRQCHGTGDLFTAVVTGGLVKGKNLPQAAEAAAEFVRCCVENTKEASLMGVAFETQLYRLWQEP